MGSPREESKGIELVRIKREQSNQALCFCSRPFVLWVASASAAERSTAVPKAERQFVLQITGHPDFGVPFGQDRIVPIFLATLAVQQKSPIVRFRSAGEMLKVFGTHNGRKEYRRVVSTFERIFGVTIFFGTDQIRATAKLAQRSRFTFLREAQIWYNRQPDQPSLSDDFENVIELSDEFYREISEHPIPTDLGAVRVLSASPAVLDLFKCGSPIIVFRLRARKQFRSAEDWAYRLNLETRSMRARVSCGRSSKRGSA